MYGIVLSVPLEEARSIFTVASAPPSFDSMRVRKLEKAKPFVTDARVCRLTHPSGKTLARWLEEIGFSRVLPTHSGIRFAGRLFDTIPGEDRPEDLGGLDRLLRPLVGIVTNMTAPVNSNPMITAVK